MAEQTAFRFTLLACCRLSMDVANCQLDIQSTRAWSCIKTVAGAQPAASISEMGGIVTGQEVEGVQERGHVEGDDWSGPQEDEALHHVTCPGLPAAV